MASDDPAHRRNQSANNAIPLQNLTENGVERTGDLARYETHQRSLSDRAREMVGSGRRGRETQYAPIYTRDRDESPTPRPRTGQRNTPTIAFEIGRAHV